MRFMSVVLIAIVALSSLAHANNPYSARRLPNESYLTKINEFKKQFNIWRSRPKDYVTAENAKVKFDQLDEKQVKTWTGSVDFETYFKNIRDERFLKKNPSFPRRLTWLYPDDGCYARAEIASQKSLAYDFSGGSKVFVFGDLTVKTSNSSSGSVSWWYHVAVAYRANDVVYIVDPAINPDQPLRLETWLSTMGDVHQLEVSICNANTYQPESECNPKISAPSNYAYNDIEEFLQLEWQRLQELGRIPHNELGENPPWKRSL